MINAGQRDDLAEWSKQLPIGRDIRADARQHVHSYAKKFAVFVQRQLDIADIVAPMLVGHDDLGSFAAPFHRPVELFRSPQHETVIEVLPSLGAEAAADIVDDDAHLTL